MKIIPRDYQEEAVQSLWDWFCRHPEGNPVINMCVGSGKSLIIAMIIQRALREFPETRIIVVAHQQELVVQNMDKLRAIWPEADVGIYSAALGRKELGCRITYATIGSIYKDAHLLGETHLILCDEAHLINTKESGMWRSFISDMKRFGNQWIKVIGLTGTPYRNGGVWITAGEDPLFHGIAANVSMRQMLDSGFLVPLSLAGVKTTISAEGISIVNGDYKINELADLVDRAELVDAACNELVQLAADRKKWIVFCVTVTHANHVRDALRERGVSAETVSGETPKSERASLLWKFKAGEIRALCNVGVLTTGVDIPSIDCIALLRNTRSPTLFVQMCGRGMRPYPGKTDCAFADFTDTTASLGPVDAITGRGPKRKMTHEKPVKLCEECGSINAVSARECIDCGAPFEIIETSPHGIRASDAAIMSGQAATLTRYSIDRVTYAKHVKPGKPPSLRVEYWHGLRVVAKEWVGFESDNYYALAKASHWWYLRTGGPTPETVDKALATARYFQKNPKEVIVNESGKYPEIVNFKWGETA